MSVILNIPADVEDLLRKAWGGELDRAAVESLAIEGYRTGKFGIAVVRKLLGVDSRWEAEQGLGLRGVSSSYSLEDLEDDRRTLASLFPKAN